MSTMLALPTLSREAATSELADHFYTTLHQHDESTGVHSRRVAILARHLGQWMGLNEEHLRHLELACLLHDVGKLFISPETLVKPSALDDSEWEQMKTHPELGSDILKPWGSLENISEIVYSHHERFDGNGYPRQLAGHEISVEARICAVVDAYDAMTSDRPYGVRLTHEQALAEIVRCSGSQFDPEIVQAFVTMPEIALIV